MITSRAMQIGYLKPMDTLEPFILASKLPESYRIFGFVNAEFYRVVLPLNYCKMRWIEQFTSGVGFFETSRVFQGFLTNVNACSNLAGYYSGFRSRITWPSAESPRTLCHSVMYIMHYICHWAIGCITSRACAPLTKTPVCRKVWWCFSRMRFSVLSKNPNVMGFFWQCKRYNKKPRYLGFWFLPI